MAWRWNCSESLARDLIHDLHGSVGAAREWLRAHAPHDGDVELVMSQIPGCTSITARDTLYRHDGDVVNAIMYLTTDSAAADAAAANHQPVHAIRGAKRERSADEAED